MQVYRGLDIGTAKPSVEERSIIPHHLVDVVDPSDAWSVRRTQDAVRVALADIEQRGRRAVLVGGTGLYVRAALGELDIPPEHLEVRAELERSTAAPMGLAAAWTELQQVDPDAARRIEPTNRRRIVRALEVWHATGRRFSSYGSGVFDAEHHHSVRLVGLWWSRPALAQRIADRVAVMRADGLDDEVARFGPMLAQSAAQAIGYREILAAMAGDTSIDDAYEAIVQRTRAFARRQRMWFRRDPRIVWFNGENVVDLDAAVLACWSPS